MRSILSKTKISLRLFIASFAVIMLVLSFLVLPARAQTPVAGNGLRISPPIYQVTVAKGQSETVSIFVENLANGDVVANPIINDFTPASSEDGEPNLILDPNKSAPGNSFKTIINPISPVPLKAGERKEVKVTLAVPQGAAGGGYYGAVRFTPTSSANQNTNGSKVSLTASVGSLFLVTVPGNLNEQMEVASFNASKDGHNAKLFNSGPITVVTRLKNTGNIHLQPFGTIVVKDMRGHVVSTTEFNGGDTRLNVLPNSTRKFENKLNIHFFGKYTAVGNFAYGSTGKTVTAQVTFYVIPYVLILAILGILIFLIFVVPRLIKSYNRRVVARSSRR